MLMKHNWKVMELGGAMNLELYENYVRQIARNGSLTRAAQEIGVTQPALSSGLAALEKHLGFRIFDRGQSPMEQTEEGEIYLDYLRRKSALESDLRQRLEACRGERDKRVSVGAPVAYAQSLVAFAVCRLVKAHPDYEVSVSTAPLDRLIGLAEDGALDCFISTGETLPGDFVVTELRRESLCLCVPEHDPVNGPLSRFPGGVIPPEGIALLGDRPFILLEKGLPIRERMDALFASAGVPLPGSVTVDQISMAVSLAALGVGCCFALLEVLPGLPAQQGLRIYTFPEELSCRRVYAACHSGFYQSRACRELIACLAESG